MMLPAANIYFPLTGAVAVANPSATHSDPLSNNVPISGPASANKKSTFSETMELLLACVPQVAPSPSNRLLESINPPVAATASSDQSIWRLNLQPPAAATPQPDALPSRNLLSIDPAPSSMTELSDTLAAPPSVVNGSEPGAAPPDVAVASSSGRAAAPPAAAPADFAEVTPEPIGPKPARTASQQPTSTESVENSSALISKSEAGAGQSDSAAKLEFSAKEDPRAQAAESGEQAGRPLPASSVEHVSSSSSAPTNQSRSVQQAGAIADQIQEALLTHLGEQHEPGRTVIHVRLNPPELGQVRVHLVTYDDQVMGRVVVQEEAVRAALESQMPELRQRLEQAGITLGRFEVAHDGRGQADGRHERPAPFQEFASAWRPPAAMPPALATATRRGLIDMLA